MGLDAAVGCNCYRDGKTSEPPVPRSYIERGDDHRFSLKDGYFGEYFDEFWNWAVSCCPHPQMDFASERIANWAGYRSFMHALDSVGGIKRFPVLRAQMPDGSYGQVSPKDSRRALDELRDFESVEQIRMGTFLIDADSGEMLQERVESYDGEFMWSRPFTGSLLPDRLIVVNNESNDIVFSSAEFQQRVSEHAKGDESEKTAEWTGLETGASFKSGIVLGREVDGDRGRVSIEPASHLKVQLLPIKPARFEHTLNALRTVFEASVETGNPVAWF